MIIDWTFPSPTHYFFSVTYRKCFLKINHAQYEYSRVGHDQRKVLAKRSCTILVQNPLTNRPALRPRSTQQ